MEGALVFFFLAPPPPLCCGFQLFIFLNKKKTKKAKQHGLLHIPDDKEGSLKKIKLLMIISLLQIYLLACGDLTLQALLAELRQGQTPSICV